MSVRDRFSNKPIQAIQLAAMDETRALGLALAEHIVKTCPAGPEREQAITWVQGAVMMANHGISR
jgi:hypothetical protein